MHKLLLAFLMATVFSPVVAASSADSVRVEAPYARAVPPGQPNSAAFMKLHSQDGATHSIVAAATTAADVVELHTHSKVDGMMRMRRVGQIDIPAQGVQLRPGGLHIMLIGLKQQLKPGQQIPLTIRFKDGSAISINAPVRKVMMGMKMKGAKPMGGMH